MYDNCTCVSEAARGDWRGPGHGSGDPSHHHQYQSVSSGFGRGQPDGPAGYGPVGGGYTPGGYNPGGYNPSGYTPGGYTPGGGYGGYSPGGSGGYNPAPSPSWTPWPQVSQQSVRAGPCELDCKDVFLIFICVTTVMHSLGSSGKVGNLLVNYR